MSAAPRAAEIAAAEQRHGWHRRRRSEVPSRRPARPDTADDALAVEDSGARHVRPPRVRVESAVGSGDSAMPASPPAWFAASRGSTRSSAVWRPARRTRWRSAPRGSNPRLRGCPGRRRNHGPSV